MLTLSVPNCEKDPDVDCSVKRISFHERDEDVDDQSDVEDDDNPDCFLETSRVSSHSTGLQEEGGVEDGGSCDPTGVNSEAHSQRDEFDSVHLGSGALLHNEYLCG